jgi:hypothetical protein
MPGLRVQRFSCARNGSEKEASFYLFCSQSDMRREDECKSYDLIISISSVSPEAGRES